MMNPFQSQRVLVASCIFAGILLVSSMFALLYGAWAALDGTSKWAETQALLKREGETLDFRTVTSEPVPDAENFCAISTLKDITLRLNDEAENAKLEAKRKRLESIGLPFKSQAGNSTRGATGATYGIHVDLKTWLRACATWPMPPNSGDAARDLLVVLSQHDGVMGELTAALDRPRSQWTPPLRTRELPRFYIAIPSPHYDVFNSLNRALFIRAIAAARAGDARKAHDSLLILAKLNQACLDETTVIGMLVGITGTAHLVNATWEVCGAQSGSALDYTRLEQALAVDLKHAALQAMRGELAAQASTLAMMGSTRQNPAEAIRLIGKGPASKPNPVASCLAAVSPSGFMKANTAVLAQHVLKYLIKPLRDQEWMKTVDSAQQLQDLLTESGKHLWLQPYHIMTVITVTPTITSTLVSRAAIMQCLIDQATIACVLERHRIEHGSYPDTLDGLKLTSGKPLPHDALTGKPMGYRRTVYGKYALWCVGFDGKDDGGKRVLDEKNPEVTKFADKNYKGDWVWDFPTAVP